MTADCADLQACADLLHEEGARLMERTRPELSKPEAIKDLRLVVSIEEVAAEVEARVDEHCG